MMQKEPTRMIKCVKCGETDLLTNWIAEGESRYEPNARSYSISPDKVKAEKEHLRHHCRTCHFEWDTETDDQITEDIQFSKYLDPFVKRMEHRLVSNVHKETWQNLPVSLLIRKLITSAHKLNDETYLYTPGPLHLAEAAADVANYAMMVAHLAINGEPELPRPNAKQKEAGA